MRLLTTVSLSLLPLGAIGGAQTPAPSAANATQPPVSTAPHGTSGDAHAHAADHPAPPPLQIRILNAQTNKPVANERLNLSFFEHEIGFHLAPTDKLGIIPLHPPTSSTTLHLLTNFYADCRPRAELYTNYALTDIRSTGITTGNLCSSAHPSPKPGELLLFVVPKNAIRQFGQAPASNLPHSDENPHAQPDNPFPVPDQNH